jgi:hypothetical protein
VRTAIQSTQRSVPLLLVLFVLCTLLTASVLPATREREPGSTLGTATNGDERIPEG